MNRTKHVDQLTEEEHDVRKAKRRDWYYTRSPEYKEMLLQKQRDYTKRKREEAEARGEKVRREYKVTAEQRQRLTMQNAISKEKRIAEHKRELEEQGLTGYQVCPVCTKSKPVSSFMGKNGNKICKICDYCRTRIYATTRKANKGFTSDFWADKARRVNYTMLKGLRKTKPEAELVDLPDTLIGEELMNLYNEQQGKCHYCGVDLIPTKLHIDHKMPTSRGGRNILANVCITCDDCNRMKWTRTDTEFIAFLRSYAERLSYRYQDKEPDANI